MNGLLSLRNTSMVLATLAGGYVIWMAYSDGPGGLLRHTILAVNHAIR